MYCTTNNEKLKLNFIDERVKTTNDKIWNIKEVMQNEDA